MDICAEKSHQDASKVKAPCFFNIRLRGINSISAWLTGRADLLLLSWFKEINGEEKNLPYPVMQVVETTDSLLHIHRENLSGWWGHMCAAV